MEETSAPANAQPQSAIEESARTMQDIAELACFRPVTRVPSGASRPVPGSARTIRQADGRSRFVAQSVLEPSSFLSATDARSAAIAQLA
jgi:hypothetical protein